MRVSKLMVCAMLAAAAVPTIQAGSLSKEPSQSAGDFAIFREFFPHISPDDFAKWTVIDANEDDVTWTFAYVDDGGDGGVYSNPENDPHPGDDWLISPEITVPETGRYIVKFGVWGDKEAMEVRYGSGAAIDSMKINPEIRYTEKVYDDYGMYFIAEFREGEKVNLGLHAVQAPDLNPFDAPALFSVEMMPFIGTPVKLWDFEDEQIPADLTFKVEDEGTIHPDAEGEFVREFNGEFNEEGWGLITPTLIFFEPYHGSFELAGISWLDKADSADRWVIFPKVHVNSENAHFVWESYTYFNNPNPEDYEVKISEGSDDPADFSTVLSVHESIGPTTHGISLADYKDKDIYVAINLRTATNKGWALLLDNLGFYGDIGEVPTGTEAIRPSETEEGFTIGEDCITANGKDVKGIEIFTMSGAKVLQTEKPVLSTAALKPGIYIVRVRTSERAYTGKFAK